MSDLDPRRRDDIVLTELLVRFNDFMDRYERDLRVAQAKQAEHHETIKANTVLLNEMAPNYRRGILVVSTILVGSLAYIIKAILSHFQWS